MTHNQRISTGIIFGTLGSVALAEVVRRNKIEKEKKDSLDTDIQKNVIVVPVREDKFMEDVATPEEQKSLVEPKQIALVADTAADGGDIEKIKKDILRGEGRKFDFFKRAGSAAPIVSEDAPAAKRVDPKKDRGSENDEKGGGNKPDKEDKDDNLPPRDELGRFTSPTDPTGVKPVEKDASNYIWDRAKAPLMYTGGALATLYLAAKLTDIINKKRREISDEDLDEARNEYVSLMQETDSPEGEDQEKSAGILDTATSGLIAGFVVPAALTSIVTKKILDNRRRDKKEKKQLADSYPEDPIILYKVSEDKTVEISPATALAMYIFKEAMFRNELNERLEKKAQSVTGCIEKVGWGSYTADEAVDNIYNQAKSSLNNDKLLALAKAVYNNDPEAVRSAMSEFSGTFGHSRAYNNPEVQAALKKKLMPIISERFADPRYRDTWGAWGNQLTSDYLAKNWGLKNGGVLNNIITWLMNTLGFGQGAIQKYIKSMMAPEEASKGTSSTLEPLYPDEMWTENESKQRYVADSMKDWISRNPQATEEQVNQEEARLWNQVNGQGVSGPAGKPTPPVQKGRSTVTTTSVQVPQDPELQGWIKEYMQASGKPPTELEITNKWSEIQKSRAGGQQQPSAAQQMPEEVAEQYKKETGREVTPEAHKIWSEIMEAQENDGVDVLPVPDKHTVYVKGNPSAQGVINTPGGFNEARQSQRIPSGYFDGASASSPNGANQNSATPSPVASQGGVPPPPVNPYQGRRPGTAGVIPGSQV